MLILFTFLAPYVIALAAYPLLLRRSPFARITPIAACLLIAWPPWLIAAGSPLLRFMAAISAAMLALKVIDVALDLRQGRKLSLKHYLQGLAAALTARVRVRGWLVLPCMAGTLAFNALSSVLFFASIHGVFLSTPVGCRKGCAAGSA